MKFRHLPLLAAIFSTLIYAQTATPPPQTPPPHPNTQTTRHNEKPTPQINL